jgi:catechol 2,3-dioxygenase-like lactoylglutathione lyase family enzyme
MVISGIQQMGIGVSNVHEAWRWYRKYFGMDIKVFEEAAEAGLMLPYTGGEPRSRHAALALNLQSGGGFEIWQYTSRTPEAAKFEIRLGDLGLYICKIKCKDIDATYSWYQNEGLDLRSDVAQDPAGRPHFYVADPYGNIFELVEGYGWFKDEKKLTGGVFGAVVGTSDIDRVLPLYQDVLQFDEMIANQEGTFNDWKGLPGSDENYRRVLLKSTQRKGAFSTLLGPGELELVQAKGYEGQRIFKDRFWGDLGFIHLCFDINGMAELKAKCEAAGYPFTVDSAESFDMGEAAGHFTYIEDPDGTLIEFVETHKVPIMKKVGWYLNLKKRPADKPLPNWLLKAFALNRVKD